MKKFFRRVADFFRNAEKVNKLASFAKLGYWSYKLIVELLNAF
ncbi:hypothetical protein [Priestia megaterium]